MNIQEVRDIAKDFGIKSSRMSKMELIKKIQLTEGNFNCFGSATEGDCDQINCSWRSDCFAVAKQLHS